MKKLTYIVFLMLFILVPVFSNKKKVESNLEFNFNTKLLFNIYGPNYQGSGPVIGKRFPLVKGNKLVIEVSGISNKDISKLYFSIVDRNSAVSYWCTLTPKNQIFIEAIRANQPFNQVFEVELINSPFSMITTCFIFMHEDMDVKTVKLTSCNIKLSFKE